MEQLFLLYAEYEGTFIKKLLLLQGIETVRLSRFCDFLRAYLPFKLIFI